MITLVRAEGYHGKNLGYSLGGAGYADRIEFHVFDTDLAAYGAYQAGQVDVALLPRELRKQEGLPVDDLMQVFTGVDYIGFPVALDGFWTDPVVRRALSMVIDRKALLPHNLGVSGAVADGFLPPALRQTEGRFGRDDGAAVQWESCIPPEPDVEGARRLLAEAGIDLTGRKGDIIFNIPNGTTFGSYDTSQSAVIQQIVSSWREAFGLELIQHGVWFDGYTDAADGGLGFPGPFRMSWSAASIAPYPGFSSAQAYLEALFAADTESGANMTRWNDPEFQQNLTGVLPQEEALGRRALTLDSMHRRLCDQMPLIPLAYTSTPWLVRKSALGSGRGDTFLGWSGSPLLREFYARG